jgi:ankyrin repeat protein
VAGTIKLVPLVDRTVEETQARGGQSTFGGTSVADSELRVGKFREIGSGEFVNEIAFLTGTPQYETVRTKTVCKTLTISRSSYKMLAADHPGSVGKVLQNLLCKVEEMAAEVGFGSTRNMNLQKSLAALNAGSEYYGNSMREVQNTVASIQTEASLTAVQDLIKMHVNKQKDDHTTRFLFAASRNDTVTISLMCDQGFDPNNADYDKRTALMVSAMKGNTEAVSKILEFQANPNIVDMHGSSALYEAARNGHEETMELLLKHGAELCMDHGQAASRLCQAVFDGDIPMLRRLLKARISVNSSDYDKRTAAHIAIAEGNVAALKVLVEFGADLTLQDRWGNTVDHEAKRLNAGQLLEYLDLLREKQKQ